MLESLVPLIGKIKSPLSPPQVHEAVNIAFHDVEAAHYDRVHADMRESLGQQMDLLVSDAALALSGRQLSLLDIGCGTGMSTELLLQTALGQKIAHVTLADTSPNMLAHAQKRAENWGIPFDTHLGGIESLENKFDIILVCSVLHHIPEVDSFLERLSKLQETGGTLLHLQDPNGDHLNDPSYLERIREFESTKTRSIRKKILGIVPKNFKTAARRMLGIKTYIDVVNDRLLSTGAIAKPMIEEEIWSVTDIHVDGLPYSVGKGISLEHIKRTLSGYELVSSRAYGFFGYLKSVLDVQFQQREQELIDTRTANGRYISGIWIKK